MVGELWRTTNEAKGMSRCVHHVPMSGFCPSAVICLQAQRIERASGVDVTMMLATTLMRYSIYNAMFEYCYSISLCSFGKTLFVTIMAALAHE